MNQALRSWLNHLNHKACEEDKTVQYGPLLTEPTRHYIIELVVNTWYICYCYCISEQSQCFIYFSILSLCKLFTISVLSFPIRKSKDNTCAFCRMSISC